MIKPHDWNRIFAMAAACVYGLAGLSTLGCVQDGSDGRTAGTSTSIGTSIGGTALLADGSPAAGARVTMRTDEIEIIDGRPQSKTLDSARTDSLGRFTFSILPGTGFHLGIDCDPVTGCGSVARQVFHREYAGVAEGSQAFGILRTAIPGSIQGAVKDSLSGSGKPIWVGIAGTDHFVKVSDPDPGAEPFLHPFRLDGMFPGEYRLTVFGITDTTRPYLPKTAPLQVKSGRVTEIGLIEY